MVRRRVTAAYTRRRQVGWETISPLEPSLAEFEKGGILVPGFANPFPGIVPRKMTHGELARAIMLDIAAELEAVHVYLAHMDAADNEDAKKVLYDVALEELVHAGEFTSLLHRLDPVAAEKAQEGFAEVKALLEEQAAPQAVPPGAEKTRGEDAESEPPTPQGLTVGSLIGAEQGE